MGEQMDERRILIGVTGASGAIYAQRLTEVLLPLVPRIYLIATKAGRQVINFELEACDDRFSLVRAMQGRLSPQEGKVIRVLNNEDLFAPVASGSSAPDSMVLAPCSMGTLARISHGTSSNLLGRAADVMLKQKRQLIVVPRESPLNTIHLKNLLTLSEMGVDIVPPAPGFYQKPESIEDLVDFVVGKILETLKIDHTLYERWNHARL